MSASDDLVASGIVLAGGRSSRFGSDKLAARLGSGTLLDRAIAALAMVASDVVIVVAPGDERVPAATPGPLRIVEDPERHGGPLVGLLAGLESVGEPIVLVVGGDMPSLRPDVLRLLARTLLADPAFDAVAVRFRGAVVPLPIALRTGAATDVARRLTGDGERRLRSVLERLSTRILEEGEWRPLDPGGETLRDVDRVEDLPTS